MSLSLLYFSFHFPLLLLSFGFANYCGRLNLEVNLNVLQHHRFNPKSSLTSNQ